MGDLDEGFIRFVVGFLEGGCAIANIFIGFVSIEKPFLGLNQVINDIIDIA